MKLENKKIKRILITVLVLLVIAGLAYTIWVPRAVKVDVAKVTVGTFTETIRADGVLRAKEHYIVPAFADGDIKRVSLKVGDEIKKGDIITELFWDIKFEPIRAPVSGVISKVFRESAGPVRRGEPIVEIVDPTNLEVMVELLTTDAVRLQPGNEAWFENWSGGKPIAAKIIRISKAGFRKQSALGVEEERTEVIADLLNPPKDLLENVGSTFHVDVIFKVSETAKALKIPVGALFRDGSSWAVYFADGKYARKQNVEVGALGADEALIKAGLHEGQLILIYPGDLVKDGTRIRTLDLK